MQAILDLNAATPKTNTKTPVSKLDSTVSDTPKNDFRRALEQQTNPKPQTSTAVDQKDSANTAGLAAEEGLSNSGRSPLLNEAQLQQRLPQLSLQSSTHVLTEPEGAAFSELEPSFDDSELSALAESGIMPIPVDAISLAPVEPTQQSTEASQGPLPDASISLFASKAGGKLPGNTPASEMPLTTLSGDENSKSAVPKPTILATSVEPGRPLTAPLELELPLDGKAGKFTGTMAALLSANEMSGIDPRNLFNNSTIVGEGMTVEDDKQSALLQSISGNLASEIQNHSSNRMQMPAVISFGKPQWAGMVAERTAMMMAQNIQSADIQMDPPELGPLHVRVHVQNDQVSVSFSSVHAPVREALDQTAMRLRELCEQQGMNLVDVDVSDQQAQQQAEKDASSTRSSPSGLPTEDSVEDPLPEKTYSVSYGVDDFV